PSKFPKNKLLPQRRNRHELCKRSRARRTRHVPPDEEGAESETVQGLRCSSGDSRWLDEHGGRGVRLGERTTFAAKLDRDGAQRPQYRAAVGPGAARAALRSSSASLEGASSSRRRFYVSSEARKNQACFSNSVMMPVSRSKVSESPSFSLKPRASRVPSRN